MIDRPNNSLAALVTPFGLFCLFVLNLIEKDEKILEKLSFW